MIETGNWKHAPWLCGIVAAPLLLGGRIPEAQAVIGSLLALGLICCGASRIDADTDPPRVPLWQWSLLIALFLAPLVPLPESVLSYLSPGRMALSREFPLDPGTSSTFYAFSCSISHTIRRLWEMSLLLAAFILARRAARERGFAGLLVKFLVVALLLLSLADFQFRLGHGKFLLGFWPDRSGHGAATFANRNHFADWVCVAVLFSSGVLIRQFSPLHAARGARLLSRDKTGRVWVFLTATSVVLGVGLVVATGSRGGAIALFFGLLVWLLLLAKRSRSRRRWFGIGFSFFLILLVAISAGDYLLSRLHDSSLPFKFLIWKDTLRMLPGFLWLGTGWGGFETVFAIRKSFGGGLGFLHAENEYLQLLFESGLLAAIPIAYFLGRVLWRSWRRAWNDRMPEPEFYFAAMAALCAFLAHSLTEFVWQVLATGLLASVLLGYLSGCETPAYPVAIPSAEPLRRWIPGMLAGILVLMVAAVQGFASWQWVRGYAGRDARLDAAMPAIESSLKWWPWAVDRQLLAVRLETRLAISQGKLAGGETPAFLKIRGLLNRALRFDPYNWQIRFERALFDLSFGTNAPRAQREALESVQINPLNPSIPLQLAGIYADADPDFAFELLQRAKLDSGDNLIAALQLAWRANPDASRLWSLIPSTPLGWRILGDFAYLHGLQPLAVEAYSLLKDSLPSWQLAELYLSAGRPDLAASTIGKTPRHAQASLVLCRAYRALGDWQSAINAAEVIWRSSPSGFVFLQARQGAELNLSRAQLYSANPRDLPEAGQLGETMRLEVESPQKEEALRRLQDRFPESLRLKYLTFESAFRARRFKPASELAEQLAQWVVTRDGAGSVLVYPPAGSTNNFLTL